MRCLLTILLLVAASADAGTLAKTCREPAFKHSCVRKLYRCFDGAGTCTRDLSAFFAAGAVTDCWANGATARLDGFGRPAGVSQLTNRKGRVCLQGATAWAADFSVAITYQRGKRRWQIARTVDGSYDVTCPNGQTEHLTPGDVVAGGCGPIADCAVVSGGCAQ